MPTMCVAHTAELIMIENSILRFVKERQQPLAETYVNRLLTYQAKDASETCTHTVYGMIYI